MINLEQFLLDMGVPENFNEHFNEGDGVGYVSDGRNHPLYLFFKGEFYPTVDEAIRLYGKDLGLSIERHKNGQIKYRSKKAPGTPGSFISHDNALRKIADAGYRVCDETEFDGLMLKIDNLSPERRNK